MESTMTELMQHTADMGQADMFSREWYNEYFRRAAGSPAHARFCEAVYGRDLCQHGMMDVEEMAFVATLLKPADSVLEIGCSNGRITGYLHEKAGCRITGVDYSDVAIDQALQRTRDKRGSLDFRTLDLIHDPLPAESYDVILAIDSIYFMGDYGETLKKLNKGLKPGGRIIVAAFQVKEENDPDAVLLPRHTRMSQALQELSFDYIQHDFTRNVREHWIKNYAFSRSLQSEFEAEGNAFLCEARMGENGWFRNHALNETLVRYLYVIGRQPSLT